MARRKSQGNVPLEWIGIRESVTDAAANELSVFDLNLDDDEMAEILGVDSDIHLTIDGSAVLDETVVEGNLALVMDPSYPVANNPYSESVYEDLETFWNHSFGKEAVITTAAGFQYISVRANKQTSFQAGFGIMLANNPAALLHSPAVGGTNTVDFHVRLYFKRRKATDMQLARTLLKRR